MSALASNRPPSKRKGGSGKFSTSSTIWASGCYEFCLFEVACLASVNLGGVLRRSVKV